MSQPGVRRLGAALLATGMACSPDAILDVVPCEKPSVLSSGVTPNSDNVLSAIVSARIVAADSATVSFTRAGDAGVETRPAEEVVGDTVVLSLFGLHAESDYEAEVIAFNRCGSVAGGALTFRTGPLPSDLPSYSATGSAPSQGFVVFAAGNYGLAIDNSGRVVWYHRFAGGAGLNFQPQPNGHYLARPTPASGTPVWTEISPLGVATRTLSCARGLVPRLHDIIAQPDGSYWLLCDEARSLELTAGDPSSRRNVIGTAVQHIGPSQQVLFEWSPFDHFIFDPSVLEPGDLGGSAVNWTHGNALDLDASGNVYVSFRNLSEITKIDGRIGSVLWRLGGAASEFQFDESPAVPFARQHGLRVVDGGVLLLDNLGESGPSRAERYVIDEAQRTARLSREYVSSNQVTALLGGSTQALPDGHVLVSYGNGGSVEEYDAAGNVVWKLTGEPGYVFRAQRVRSLYQPGVADAR